MPNVDLRTSFSTLKTTLRDAMDDFISDGEGWLNAVDEARKQLQQVTGQVQAAQVTLSDLNASIARLAPEKKTLELQVEQLRRAIASVTAIKL